MLEFIVKMTAWAFILPLGIKALNKILDSKKIMFITGKNVVSLLKNPFSYILLLAGTAVWIMISYYETVCIRLCLDYAATGRRMKFPDVIFAGLNEIKNDRSISVKKVLFSSLLIPVSNYTALFILSRKIDLLKTVIHYAFFRLPNFVTAIITAFISLIAFSFMMFFRIDVKSRDDRRKKKRYFLKCFAGAALVNVVTAVSVMAVYLLLLFLAAVTVRFFGKASTAFARMLAMEDIIEYVMAFLAAAASIIVNNVLLYSVEHRTESDISDCSYHLNIEKAVRGKNLVKTVIASSVVLLILFEDISIVYGYAKNGSQFLEDLIISTTVTAHRGGAKFAPENTMDSISYAVSSGADYVEIDVQLSKDDVVFLLHDDSLKRTTGINKKAYNLDYEELSKLDAGSWFSGKFADAGIPTLDEVLSFCKGKINLNIELKKSGNKGNKLVDEVIALIDKYDMRNQCVLTSTSYAFLRYAKKHAPDIRTGYIANMLFGETGTMEYADFFSVKYVIVSDAFVKEAHAAGKEVHVWTVNSKYLINRMKGFDVDSIITDDPKYARKILSRKNDRKSLSELFLTLLYKNRKK